MRTQRPLGQINSQRKGSALIAVAIAIVIASVGIALVVKYSLQKQDDVTTQQTTTMLREANTVARDHIDRAILYKAVDGGNVDGAFLDEQLRQLDRSLRSKYPRFTAVAMAAPASGDLGLNLWARTMAPTDKTSQTDAFRLNTGTRANPTQGPLYDMEIGYRADNDLESSVAQRNASNFIRGYQISYQGVYDGRVVGAENIAWGHYAPPTIFDGTKFVANQDAVVNLDLWQDNAVYIQPASNVTSQLNLWGTDQSAVLGYRTGSVFINSPVVGSTTAEVLSVTGAKPVFARKGFAGMIPLTYTPLVPVVGQATGLTALTTADLKNSKLYTYTNPLPLTANVLASVTAAEKTVGASVSNSAANSLLGASVFTESQLNNQSFAVLSERGVREVPGYSRDGKDFWSTTPGDVADELFTPASRASIRVEVSATLTATGLVPEISKVYPVLQPGMPLPAEDWRLIALDNSELLPNSTLFWAEYKQHVDYDTGVSSTVPTSTLKVNGTDTLADRAPASITARRQLYDWVLPLTGNSDILTGNQVVRFNVGGDLQIFLSGAVAYYNSPKNVLLYPNGIVVVDISRMGAEFPYSFTTGNDARDPNVTYKGVFVDVKPPLPFDSDAVKNLYLTMLNSAMVLIGRDYTAPGGAAADWGITRAYRTGAADANETAGRLRLQHYTAKFPETETNTVFVLGTNGRITFDTDINLNLGTNVGTRGSLLTATPATNLADMRKDLSAYYGDPALGGVASPNATPESTPGIHQAIFASRLRPGLATFVIAANNGTASALGNDASVSNADLFGNGRLVLTAWRALARTPIPGLSPVNAYNNTALNGQLVSTLPQVRVYDAPLANWYAEGGGLDYAGTEANINDNLLAFTRNYIQTAVNQVGNPLYSQSLAARLSSTDPALAGAKADLLNPASGTSLLSILGRREDVAFYRVVFQRYGMLADYDDTYTVTSDYNFRVQFSGNIKQEIWRDCLVNGVTTPTLFRAEDQAKVVTGGAERSYTFENCPSLALVGLVAKHVYNQDKAAAQQDQTLGGLQNGGNSVLSASGRVYGYFYPAVNTGPESMATAVAAYLAPGETKSLDTIVAGLPKMSGNPVSLVWTTGNGALETSLQLRANRLLQNNRFTLATSNTNWLDVMGLSPFFGRIEYTLADSLDDESWMSSQIANQKVYAAWTIDPGLRLAQVKIYRYNTASSATGSRSDVNLPLAGFSTNEQAQLVTDLDAAALTALDAAMATNLNSATKIANFTSLCLPLGQVALPPDQMDGQIGGAIHFLPPSSIADLNPTGATPLGWSLFLDPVFGHTLVDSKVDFTQSIPQLLSLVASQDTNWTPTFAISGTQAIPVRGTALVARERFITAKVYEPSLASAPPGMTLFVDSHTGFGDLSLLSPELTSALASRRITFKLVTAATFADGSQPTLGGFDFVGAGTLFTSADSPQPFMTNVNLIKGADVANSDVFAWHGSIKTGVGTPLGSVGGVPLAQDLPTQADVAFKPITYIYGDPLLSSRVWGRLSTAQATPVPGQEKAVNKVTRSR